MTKLADCEITHRHIRGHNVVFLFGVTTLTDDEAQALAAEFREAYGPGPAPGYVSPAGWQTLDVKPVEKPAAKPAAKNGRAA